MKINKGVLERFFLFVLSASCFVMISCDEENPCSNIKNGVGYKKNEPYDGIDKLEGFGNNYSKQYAELIEKIKVLYEEYGIVEGQEGNNEDYGNDENQGKNKKEQEVNNKDYETDNDQDGNNEDYESDESDDEYKPPDEFITKVREIVEQNKEIYEETYKQIDKYTHKIPPMPWAFGCTIKGLVMYILHNPIIKCAVQYFDNYKNTRDETRRTFDEMVMNPKEPIDEWHNCLVTFIRLLKLTYEELESDKTDVKVHGKLWNQIQGLEYLLHFLCFGYRRGWFAVANTINFLEVFLNILGVFDFSEKPGEFELDKKNLKYKAYCCCENGFIAQPFGSPQYVSKKYLDSICCEDFNVFSENISDIITKSNRTNWMIQDNQGDHVFHFYVCKNEDETVYYIHDGWYEYKNFLKKILPDLPKKGCEKPIYYSIPFTFIIIPYHEERRITILDKNLILAEVMTNFWDSLIPLLSTDLDLVKKCSDNLYTNFICSNENEKKVLFRYFLDYLVNFISYIVETYKRFKPDKNSGEFNFKDAIKDLMSLFKVYGDVLSKDEKNIDIVAINNDYYSEKKRIDKLYSDKKNKGEWVENKNKVQPMLQLLMETINKIKWFLGKENVVDLILGYHDIPGYKTELQVAFIKKNIVQIPEEINEMFEEWVRKYFSSFWKKFVFLDLVHGKNGASQMYDGDKYTQADVLMVDWTTAGLEEKDLPIFRGKFEKYEFFKSAQFSDVVK